MLTNLEKVRTPFDCCLIGTLFTRSEVIQKVTSKYPGTNARSIIPSDYCYNITNDGKLKDKTLFNFNVFEYQTNRTYMYIGENYLYTGNIIHNARNTIIGNWLNGKI
jgi:hypothetical protein